MASGAMRPCWTGQAYTHHRTFLSRTHAPLCEALSTIVTFFRAGAQPIALTCQLWHSQR